MTKVEEVLYNTAKKFYLKIGKSELEATQLALEDVKKKMDIEDDTWIDITTNEIINGTF